MRYIALFLLSLVSSVAGLAQAQEPPGRVGRLAYTQGTVSVYQDPDLGWDKAYINTPITSENSIWTERGSRAELRVSATAIRLDQLTQLDVSRLDENEIDASIERGSASIRVRYKQPYHRITLSTPYARFSILSDGRYRIDTDPEREESSLTVFAGDARMESQGGRIRVTAGSTVRVFGGPSSSYVTERARVDAFDRWTDARDRDWTDSRSRRYVSTNMTGYEELDRYGEWVEEPSYGALWFPTRVASDWAPYRTGHWGYVRPWGWTWIDESPWGYAPFHYGRWVNVRDRWAWSPGQRVDRPAWAPALVGWVGGSNWNLSASSGASAPVVGWYPLSPSARYEPWYRSDRAYTDRINIAVRDFAPRQWDGRNEDWRTYNRDRGTTVVQREALIDRRPVESARVQVGLDTLRQQQIVAPAQVQQMLPQGNELIRRRTDRNTAPVAAPPVLQAQPAQQAQPGRPAAPAQVGNQLISRPTFARPDAPAPMPTQAPANQPPAQALGRPQNNPFNPAAPSINPAARGQPGQDSQQQAREVQQQQERAQREAQQQQQQAQQAQERAQREAQQQQQNQLQQQRQVREAQQQQQQQQAQQAAQQAAQQQQAQERAQREAQQQQQQQLQQQRQVREAQQQQQQAQQAAQQQAQQAAQQLQQQQERAAREAQQQAQQAQQAAQQAQQAAQRAAQQAQEQQNRSARGGQPPPQQPQAQPPAQPQAQPQPQQANPAARGNRDQKEKDAKDAKDEKDKKDKEDKQR